jgi:predicted Zn-dependent protease
VRGILLALLLLTITACETVPVTGRSQLQLVSEGEETKMGIDAYQGILNKSKVSSDPRLNELVTRVGTRIAEATGRNDYQWEFKVLDDPQVNAFCLPGGNVAVYPGLFPMARDDVGLAAVLGQRSRTRSRDTAASACRSSSPLRDSRPPPRRRFSPGTIRA